MEVEIKDLVVGDYLCCYCYAKDGSSTAIIVAISASRRPVTSIRSGSINERLTI
jgi:hypothetical protein